MEVHIVVKGDTLWKIARQYGIPFEELKRVNAHLANPDYIVPGMKIFLPAKTQGEKQEHVKHPEKGKVPVKPTPTPSQPAQPTHPKPMPPKPTHPTPTPSQPTHPTHPKPTPPKPTHPTHPKPTPPKPTHPTHPKPTPPKPTHPTHPKPTPPKPTHPTHPKPTPPTPIQPTHPKPTPPVQVPQPIPLPTPSLPGPPPPQPTPVPPPMPPQMQPLPMPPFVQHVHPMIGIPCAWMPIFDADCHPFMHCGQIQAMPQPPASEQPGPLPLPTPSLPSTQFPVYEYEEECEESPIFSSQGPATVSPAMIEGWQLLESPECVFEESPEIDLELSAWCPPEQGYVPQAMSPAMQSGFPMMPFPAYSQDCGCGCGGYNQPPMMMMPIFYGHPCNCQPSMFPTPYQMMPAPYQGSNWYGSY